MSNRLPRARTLAALACVAGAAPALVAATPATASITASAATSTCSHLPSYPGVGYFTSLKVTGLSCATGKKVMLAHYRCRVKNGKRGTCPKFRYSSSTYRCTESRVQGTENYNSRVTCKSGTKKIVYVYQQDK